MKLSEAIRAGAKIRPQGRGDLRVGVIKAQGFWARLFRRKAEAVETTCALGAAIEAAGCETRLVRKDSTMKPFRGAEAPEGEMAYAVEMPQAWNQVLTVRFDCPQCEMMDIGYRLIPHLNDDHKWTREEVALWVERQERADIPAPASQVEYHDEVLEASEVG